MHILFCNNYLAVKRCCESNHQTHYLPYQKCQKSEIKGHIHIHELILNIIPSRNTAREFYSFRNDAEL